MFIANREEGTFISKWFVGLEFRKSDGEEGMNIDLTSDIQLFVGNGKRIASLQNDF